MKERPIIFSGEMVKAILDGRKTQTRRIIKPQPISEEKCYQLTGSGYSIFTDSNSFPEWRIAGAVGVVCKESGLKNGYHWKCPYGQPGDRIWVREKFHIRPDKTIFYAEEYPEVKSRLLFKWKPSIHMPRWASRITLEIVQVRVELLQDISQEDARKEGMHCPYCETEKGLFENLWNKIHGPDAWDKNPWVWVIEFRRIT